MSEKKKPFEFFDDRGKDKIQFRLERRSIQRAREIAKEEGITLSSVLRQLVNYGLEQYDLLGGEEVADA